MADFAVDEACAAEMQRQDCLNGEMGIQEAYDHGLIGPLGEDENMGDARENAATPWNVGPQLDLEINKFLLSAHKHESYQDETNYRPKVEGRIKTLKYLQGFAKHYKTFGRLSEKQRSIIDSNVEGGTEAFVANLNREGKPETKEKGKLNLELMLVDRETGEIIRRKII